MLIDRNMADTFDTLDAAKRRWPQHSISGTGKWAVVLCHQVKLEGLPMFAMAARRAECGADCVGINQHRIEELKPAVEAARKTIRWKPDAQRD
ncbi:MAG: hypothetical protein WB729_06700 [Candidatus Sulfotelmatobacter sp.]